MIAPMKSLVLLLTGIALLAQTRDPSPLQTIVLTVTNSAGQIVPNLKQDAIVVEENGVRQEITRFSEESETPVSLGILIDKSASMRLPVAVVGQERVPAALLAADGAARVVVRLTKPQDEYLFMTFDEGLQVKQSFTT